MCTFVLQIVGNDLVQRVLSILQEKYQADPLGVIVNNLRLREVTALGAFYKDDCIARSMLDLGAHGGGPTINTVKGIAAIAADAAATTGSGGTNDSELDFIADTSTIGNTVTTVERYSRRARGMAPVSQPCAKVARRSASRLTSVHSPDSDDDTVIEEGEEEEDTTIVEEEVVANTSSEHDEEEEEEVEEIVDAVFDLEVDMEEGEEEEVEMDDKWLEKEASMSEGETPRVEGGSGGGSFSEELLANLDSKLPDQRVIAVFTFVCNHELTLYCLVGWDKTTDVVTKSRHRQRTKVHLVCQGVFYVSQFVQLCASGGGPSSTGNAATVFILSEEILDQLRSVAVNNSKFMGV